MDYFKELKKKIINKKATICVVGLGYVGRQILRKFERSGYKTIGIDIDKNIIKKNIFSNKTTVTNNYKYIKFADVIIITLPTPLKKNLSPDLSFITNSIRKMDQYIRKGQLISLESTTYPGTTEEIIGGFISRKKLNLSKDFFLVYSPERISPELKVKGVEAIKYGLHNTPKICAGYSKNCCILGKELYRHITKKVVIASNLKVAETAKMIENIFRSVNIALVNELKMFLSKIDIDIHDALNLAGTKPFGFTQFGPGPGYGGHCIPLDPFYLYWLAKKNNFDLKFIKTAGDINRRITSWITRKIINFIKKNRIKLPDKKILILGVAYKRNIDDTRESPAFKIAEKLKKNGFDFEYSDPHVEKIKFNNKTKKSKKITTKLLKKYKIVLIVTDHHKFNYKLISDNAEYIFDCRNSIKNRIKNYYKV